jgi:GR25 family glycosyltransferase involved in LPS biosynthesis
MNNINDIKNIFYINLESRPDRKKFFENQMKMVRLNAIRFNAIKNSCGAVGCSLSHLALLKYAKKNNLDHILIMEDDIMFLNPQLFIHNLNNFLKNHKSFDVLIIAGNNMGEYTRIDENCVKVQHCQTTTGYLVKSHYYDKLIHNFEEGVSNLIKNINLKDDYALDQYWTKLQLIDNWYLLTPLTVSQKPDYSDIENKHINYNYVMLDLDKTRLRQMRYIQEQKKLPNTMNTIIHK